MENLAKKGTIKIFSVNFCIVYFFPFIRYEKKEFQCKVSDVFNRIYKQEQSYWHAIDASLSIDDLHEQISTKSLQIINDVDISPLSVLR